MTQLFVNNLTVIDFSYFDNQRGILGESWVVDIELHGALDEQGMVFDFGQVKKTIKAIIDDELDHRFVVSSQARNFNHKPEKGSSHLSWDNIMGHYEHFSPDSAIVILDVKTINTKSVARYLENIITKALPDNVSKVSLTLTEETTEEACYRYSHSLKKHAGNCQRIIHGHRSKIEIYENHQRSTGLEDYWSACFRNMYIGTREDITDTNEIDGKKHITFSYRSSQGVFSATLPEKRVYLIDCDSTVELIATHIAENCLLKNPGNHYRVKAYEGIGKGAIAVAC